MFYILLSIIAIYLLFSIIKYKQIPESISDTFYLGNKWWFTFTMVVLGFLICAILIPITSELYQFTAFLTGAGLLLVGATPHIKDMSERKVHFGGALIFGLMSQIWASLYCSPWLLLTWIFLIPLWKTKQRIFWMEFICIINIILASLI